MPGVFPADRHMDDCAGPVALMVRDTQPVHQAAVAGSHFLPVNPDHHAVAADLLHVAHAAQVDFLSVGFSDTHGNRMGGCSFCQRGILQQFLLRHRAVMDRGHLKLALGQRAGLIKHHHACPGQFLQVVRSLHQDAGLSGAADSGKEAQRNADHQCARAADHQEGQRPVNPVAPFRIQAQEQPAHRRRKHRKRQRAEHDCRRIVLRKPRDKVLGAGFPRAGIFHEIEDLRYRTLTEFPCGADLQHAAHIHAAADHLIAGLHIPRQAFTGQGAGIQRSRPFFHNAVDRDLFPGLDRNQRTDLHLVRIHPRQLSVLHDVRVIRPDIHHFADVPAAFAHRIALEQLADLVKQHHRNSFHIVPGLRQTDGQRTDGCHRHQEVLIEYLAV